MQKTRIGPFAIEERLPGAASTYRAVHVEQRTAVALKLLPATFGTTLQMQQMFMDEAATLKMLRHPHLVRCFGGGLDRQQAYLVYELIAGESLRQLLERRGRIPWESSVALIRQIASALDFLHERQVFHLALQPEKILIGANEQVKILDVRPSRLQGTVFATPSERGLHAMRYWAPERFSDILSAPHQTELYAIGCMLYEMLTGQPPYVADDAAAVQEAHQQAGIPRVTRLVLDCPVWLDALVQQLLAKEPMQRVKSARALLRALDEAERHIAKGTSVAEHAVSGLSPLRAPGDPRQAAQLLKPSKPKKRRSPGQPKPPFWERAWFLALCLLVVIATVFWLMMPPSEEQLFRRAEALIQSGQDGSMQRARRDYLEPLLRRFPNGKYAAAAQAYIDQMDMQMAEARLRAKLRLGRELKNEGERLLAEAWKYQQFGDIPTAKEKYLAMRHVLPEDEEHRPFRLIAEQALRSFENQQPTERAKFLADRLADAEQLADAGKTSEARLIWQSIVSLYRDQTELAEYVQQAQTHLRQLDKVSSKEMLHESSQPQ